MLESIKSPGLARQAFWLGILFLAGLETLVVSLLVDARGITTNSATSATLYYAGDFLKWLITASAIFLLFIFKNFNSLDYLLAKNNAWLRYAWILPAHGVCYFLFLALSQRVFSGNSAVDDILIANWIAVTTLTLATFALLIAPAASIVELFKQQKGALILAATGGLVVVLLSFISRALWEPLSGFTMHGAYLILDMVYEQPYIDVPGKLLGVHDFIVHIAPVCSGIDGMVLAIGISSAYLYFSRAQLRFPSALAMIPAAALLALLFNVLRVALLIAIGASFSEEIAVEGFHSVAGWISSVLVALFIIFVFSSLSFFQRETTEKADENAVSQSLDQSRLATGILLPFIIFLAGHLITEIFKGEFDYLYPLKLLPALAAMLYFFSRYELKRPPSFAEPVLWGAVAGALWIVLVPTDPAGNDSLQSHLVLMPIWLLLVWSLCRVLGFLLFAPVVEELVFRCYLLNRLSGEKLGTDGQLAFSAIAFFVSTLLFAFVHGDWIAGTAAGALFAIARYRSNTITSPIIAHFSANLLVGIWAIATQNWLLI